MNFGKLICFFGGHKRGKRINPREQEGFAEYRCPRCAATWTRKVKAKS
jgi:transposase-like protein